MSLWEKGEAGCLFFRSGDDENARTQEMSVSTETVCDRERGDGGERGREVFYCNLTFRFVLSHSSISLPRVGLP